MEDPAGKLALIGSALAGVLLAARFVAEPETFPVFQHWLRYQSGAAGDPEAAELVEATSRDMMVEAVAMVDSLADFAEQLSHEPALREHLRRAAARHAHEETGGSGSAA
jgi:hypothetical protein